ncbi:hypothetical protein BYT27DRAFT_7215108 [Phlegmacium glaucopus]|nr:hypothetical protein BYT27DRAFT_7215108 [Phlegmacium glaucopus]
MVESWSSPSFDMVMVVVVGSGGHNGQNAYKSKIIVCQGGSHSRDSAVMGSLIDDDDMAVDYRRPTAVAFQNLYRSRTVVMVCSEATSSPSFDVATVVVIGSGARITSRVVGVVGVVARVVGIVAGVVGVVVVQ